MVYFDRELYVYFERNGEVKTHVGYGPSGLGRNQAVTHNLSRERPVCHFGFAEGMAVSSLIIMCKEILESEGIIQRLLTC